MLSTITQRIDIMQAGSVIVRLGFIIVSYLSSTAADRAIFESWDQTDNVVIGSNLLNCHTRTERCSSQIKASVVCMNSAQCKSVLYDISSSKCHIFSYSLKGRFTVSPTPTGLTYLETLCDADDYEELMESGHCTARGNSPKKRDCQAHHDAGIRVDGVYTLRNDDGTEFDAWCEFDTNNGWTVIQRRQDGSQDFHFIWADYKQGFGDLNNEYWLGNDYIHQLTKHQDQRLHISLTAVNGSKVTADYASFHIGDESEQYRLHTCGFNGMHGNALYFSIGFSTRDADNDYTDVYDCADLCKGGWWFTACGVGNLNGLYGQGNGLTGITWYWYQNRYDDNFVASVIKITRG